MAGVTTSTLSTTIIATPLRERQELIDTVFKYADTFAMWPDLASREGVASFGGDGYEIPLIVAGNDSAEVFVEDGVVPDAGYQQKVVAKAAYVSLRVFTRLTGHAKRQMGRTWDSDSAPWIIGGRDDEAEMALGDLLSLWEQTFLGTAGSKAIYNLYGIVDDSTTNYYDQSRTTYATLASYVGAGGSAAITTAILDAALQGLYDATYGGKAELLLMSPTQARKYDALIHAKTTLTMRGDMAGGAPWMHEPYGGIPVMSVRGLPNSLIWMLSGIDRHWGWANHETAPGGIDILPYGVQSDAKITQFVMSGALICKQPRQQGVIESLGTT